MSAKYTFITTIQRSIQMSKIKSKDTLPEILLRKALWRYGLRYRKNVSHLPGKPDLLILKSKIVIFVDGEFWHGYNWEEKKQRIKSNRDYWIAKIEGNIARDKKNNLLLLENDYTVMRFWQHEIKNNLDECINLILEELRKNSPE